MRKPIVLPVVLAAALAGCAGVRIPVAMDPASFGRATAKVQNDITRPDGTKETCSAEFAAGMEASGIDVNADLCHGGDKMAGKAASLSGKEAQLGELDKWGSLSEQQQGLAFKAAGDALKVGGPLACVGVLTAVGFPAAAPACAALAGVQVPLPPVHAPASLLPGAYVGPRGHVRTLLGQPSPGRVRYVSDEGREHVVTAAAWRRWAAARAS